MAIATAKTSFIFPKDVDFLPSKDFRKTLIKQLPRSDGAVIAVSNSLSFSSYSSSVFSSSVSSSLSSSFSSVSSSSSSPRN